MKYLLKKADHDMLNRDSAIVYAGGKFYLGGTHNICLKKIKDDNPEIKTVLRSFLYRADVEQFQEISKYVGTVILAHLVEREDGVFIDFGIIDGEYKDYDNIPDKYKKEFENEFGMKTYDEMKHDVNINKNPELNPYHNDAKQMLQNVDKEINKLTNNEEIEEFLENNGYNRDGAFLINEDRTIAIFLDEAAADISIIGQDDISYQLDEIPKIINNIETPALDAFERHSPKNLICEFEDYSFFMTFENNKGIEVNIRLNNAYDYVIIDNSDLRKELPSEFNIDNIDECMEFIMNWEPLKEKTKTLREILKLLNSYLLSKTSKYKISWYEFRRDISSYKFDIIEYDTDNATTNEYSLFVNIYTGEITDENGNFVGN